MESLRVGALGEVIGWGVIEAREAGGRMVLRRRENGMGTYVVEFGYYHDMT